MNEMEMMEGEAPCVGCVCIRIIKRTTYPFKNLYGVVENPVSQCLSTGCVAGK